MKKYILSIIIICNVVWLSAQALLDNEFILNPYVLSPSNSGYNGNHELFIQAENHFSGLPGAPIAVGINYNGIIKNNSGIGAKLSYEGYGAFTKFKAAISYGHHFSLGTAGRLSLGIGFNMNHTALALWKGGGDAFEDDVVLKNSKSEVAFNASAGITYSIKGLMLTGAIFSILPDKVMKQYSYSQKQMLRYSAGYNIHLKPKWSLTPQVVIDHYLSTRIIYNAVISAKYSNRVWVNLGYGNDVTLSGGLGALFGKRLVMQYTFKYGLNTLYRNSFGSHELTLGVLIGKNKNSYLSHSSFNASPKSPYHEWE